VYFPNNRQGVQGKVSFSLRTADAGWWRDYLSDMTLATGVWYHVVGTYKPGAVNLYVNGRPAMVTRTDVRGPIVAQSGHLYIGAEHAFPNDEYFKGQIDEVRIYRRALSADEVEALYSSCFPAECVPHILTVGFSYDPRGDQDVTRFFTDETLYVNIKDVDLEGAGSRPWIRVHLSQPALIQGRGMINAVQELKAQPDGSFTGAIPLAKFHAGNVRVIVIGGDRSPDYWLSRSSTITIMPLK
jgi:hypothetical protein